MRRKVISEIRKTAIKMKSLYFAIIVLFAGTQCAPFPPQSVLIDCGLYCPSEISKDSPIVRRAKWFVMEKLGPGHRLEYIKKAEMEMTSKDVRYYLHLQMWKNGFPQLCTAVVYYGGDGFLQYDPNMSNC